MEGEGHEVGLTDFREAVIRIMRPGVSYLGVSPSFTTANPCDCDQVNRLL